MIKPLSDQQARVLSDIYYDAKNELSPSGELNWGEISIADFVKWFEIMNAAPPQTAPPLSAFDVESVRSMFEDWVRADKPSHSLSIVLAPTHLPANTPVGSKLKARESSTLIEYLGPGRTSDTFQGKVLWSEDGTIGQTRSDWARDAYEVIPQPDLKHS